MFKKSTCWIVLGYGLLLVILGYLGYQNAGSQASLAMGCGSGALVLLSAYLLFNGNKIGTYLSIIMSALLTVTFLLRYSNSGKTLPGCLTVISGLMVIFLLAECTKERKIKRKGK